MTDGWIAVSDRLPDRGRYASDLVLVTFACGRPTVGWCGTDGNTGWIWHTDARLDDDVTHWRPLPPAPVQP